MSSIQANLNSFSNRLGYHLLATRTQKEGVINIFIDRTGYLIGLLANPKGELKRLSIYPQKSVSSEKISFVQQFLQPSKSFLRFNSFNAITIEPKLCGGGQHDSEELEIEKGKTLLSNRLMLQHVGKQDVQGLFTEIKHLSENFEDFASTFDPISCRFLAKILHKAVDFLQLSMSQKGVIFRKERKNDLIQKLSAAIELLKERKSLLAEQAAWSLKAAQVGISNLPENNQDWNLLKSTILSFGTKLGPLANHAQATKGAQGFASSAWYTDLLNFRGHSLKQGLSQADLSECITEFKSSSDVEFMIGAIEQLTDVALYAKEPNIRKNAFEAISAMCACDKFSAGVVSRVGAKIADLSLKGAADLNTKIKETVFPKEIAPHIPSLPIQDKENLRVRGAVLEALALIASLSQDELQQKAIKLLLERKNLEEDAWLSEYHISSYREHAIWAQHTLPKGIFQMRGLIGIPSLPDLFVKRDGFDIEEEFKKAEASGNNRFLLSGLPGSGKSLLAASYAKDHADQYDWVYWMEGSKLEQSIRELGELLGCVSPEERITNDEAAKRLTSFLRRTKEKYLLILDNASSSSNFLTHFSKEKGRLIITSKNNIDGIPSFSSPVASFTEEEALYLLGLGSIGGNQHDLREIATQLACFPLGIAVAASYLDQTKILAKEYLQILKEDSEQPKNPLQQNWPLVNVFKLTFEKIRQISPEAAEILKVARFCAPHAIPIFLLEDSSQKAIFTNPAIDILLNYNLLTKDGEGYTIHQVAQEQVDHFFFQDQESEKTASLEIFRKRLDKEWAFLPNHPSTWKKTKFLIPHVIAFCNTMHEEQEFLKIKAYLLSDLGIYSCYVEVNLKQTIDYLTQALDIQKKVLGEEHPDVAASLSNLGIAYKKQGDVPQALDYYTQSLAIQKKALGEEHPDVAVSLNNLGSAYAERGDVPQALDYYTQSLTIQKKVLREEHPDVALTLNNLGSVHKKQGDLPQALDYYTRSLAIRKKVLGKEHPDVAVSLSNLGSVYKKQGDLPQALDYYTRSLAIRKKVFGEGHPDVALSLSNLGLVYQAQRDFPQAIDYHTRSLAIRKKVFGEGHPDVALSLSNLGLVYQAQRDFPQAIDYHTRSLAIRKKVFGEGHPDVAFTQNNLDLIYQLQKTYQAQKNFPEAIEFLTQSVANGKKNLSEGNPYFALSMIGLASICEQQGDFSKAIDYYTQSLAIFKKVYGENHPNTTLILRHLEMARKNLATKTGENK